MEPGPTASTSAQNSTSRAAGPSILGPFALIAAGLCLIPLDGIARTWPRSISVNGDFKRELEMLQQFGDLATTIIAILIVLLLDPAETAIKVRRICDWVGAALASGLLAHALKVLIGRPRPLFADPLHATGPVGKYPVELKDGSVALIHSWDYSSGVANDLWSMPSSHAMAAACMATVLTALYPRLRWLAVAIVGIVCLARVLLQAHYPSDVFVGAGLGWWIASAAMTGRWGSRIAGLALPLPVRAADNAAIGS